MKEYAKCLYYENACFDNPIVTVRDGQNRKHLTLEEVVNCLNEQQDQISYWKHKVSSLLWILGQFDEEKVKELLKELEDERETIYH